MLLSAQECSNNYYRACLYAYLGDFKNFNEYFGLIKVRENELISPYIVNGIRFSLEFAENIDKKIKNVYFNQHIASSISARYIMSNTNLDNKIIETRIPASIWYPNSPSKDTCLYLLKRYKNKYVYQIAVLAIINNWPDIHTLCELDKIKTELCTNKISAYYNGTDTNKDIKYCYFNFRSFVYNYVAEDNLKNNETYYSKTIYDILFQSFVAYYQFEEEDIDSFIDKYEEDEIYFHYSIDGIGYSNRSSIGLNLIRYEKNLSTNTELSKFNVKYNLFNSICVLNNQSNYDNNICKLAVTNYLINVYYDKDLVDKFKPFYLYSYKTLNKKISWKILENHPDLKYNVFLIFAINNGYVSIEKYDIQPDVDLLDYARRSSSWDFYNILYEKAKKNNILYKHLDFNNETTYKEPIKIDIRNLNDYFRNEGHPLLVKDERYFM